MATNDLLSLAEAKRVLRISQFDDTEDDELAVYISAASDLLDQHIGPTVARAVTSETHDGVNTAGTARRRVIVLRHRPVTAIGSLTVDGSTTLSQTTDYLAAPYPPDETLFSGLLRRRFGDSWGAWEWGTGNVVCSYTAGRVQSTTDVPARIKRACGIVLENLWRDREPGVEEIGEYVVPRQSFPGFALPAAARQLLVREMGEAETFGIGA